MLAATLKKAFDPFFNAPLQAWTEFAGYCEPVKFARNEVIKREGAIERYFYFILKGSAGLFLWKENHFVCLDFAFDHSGCCDLMSLLTHQPTPLEVVALEPSEMLRISRADFFKLCEKPVGRVILQKTTEGSFVDKQKQQIELLTLGAEQRYAILLQTFPDIHQRIAQKHIASYLGITPQSLSRIRRQIRNTAG